ncbi:MAG: hypothetical protein QOH12_750 [Solirubrobacteraceae bacterium]|nr:hypothetical protein [Solirubrobacteraceae bacterium]
MNDPGDDTLDGLIDRLERAAEQLRSGELSSDAAASLVEDCAILATRTGAELDRRARAAVEEPLPGQDTLL